MFEKFTSADAANFRQRYLNTYGFFRQEDRPKLLVRLNRIDATVGFVDKDGIGYGLNADSEKDIGFEFLPPKAGWHNASDGAWLVKRIAARQWSRGISRANTQISTPSGQAATVDFPILAQLYENTTPIDAALKRFNLSRPRDTGYFAVSEQFAVNVGGSLMCFDNVIGSFVRDEPKETSTFRITLEDTNFWRQEITDAFRRANIPMEIV